MKKAVASLTVCAILAVFSQSTVAGTDIFFNPLTQSAVVAPPNHIHELNNPWQVPVGISQENLTSLNEIEADTFGQSIIRTTSAAGNRATSASMFDMIAFDDTGKYIFIPHETFIGAGVSRYDIENDFVEVILAGDEAGINGDWSNDWGAFDPSTYSPNGTLLLGEEWSGEGRIIEILNPKAPVHEIKHRELKSIANVSHEGLRFSHDGKTLYYVDEWNSGSIYKFIAKKISDYTVGQTFVLSVDAYKGVAEDLWDDASNMGTVRTGLATWIPLTNRNGRKLKPYLNGVDPFMNGPTNDPRFNDDTRGGRSAADVVNATPFGRPEDVEVGKLANGSEVLYFAATSEKAVYAVEMLSDKKAIVKLMVQGGVTPQNLGYAPTTGVLNSPDNLAQDALGNIYIIEDAPNSSNIGGDIWFVRDVNTDGIAESIDHFMSLQVDGAESTGMIFNPKKPTEFVVAVQHPDSTDLAKVREGFGDALWKFDLKDVAPPICQKGNKVKTRFGGKHKVKTCADGRDFNFVKALKKVNKHD